MEPEPELGYAVAWEEETVRSLLVSQGQAVHALIGKHPEEWVYTDGELRAIAPPLTRILNRYDVTRAAAATGDEIALVVGLFGYITRSYLLRRAALDAAAAAEPETRGAPVFGEGPPPAPRRAGPETEPGQPLVETPPIPPTNRR